MLILTRELHPFCRYRKSPIIVASSGCFFAHLSYSPRTARLASSFFMLARVGAFRRRHILGGVLGRFRRPGQRPAGSSSAGISEFAYGVVRHFCVRQASPTSLSLICRSYRTGVRAFFAKRLKHSRRSAPFYGGRGRLANSNGACHRRCSNRMGEFLMAHLRRGAMSELRPNAHPAACIFRVKRCNGKTLTRSRRRNIVRRWYGKTVAR